MPGCEHLGVMADIRKDVYEPAEDTFLLMDAVAHIRGKKCLEIGTGAGMVAILLAKNGNEVTATDIDPGAVACATANAETNGARIMFKRADLFSGIKGRFDVIAFNPPYLPTEADDSVKGPLNKALDGGPDGLAVTKRFLEGARKHLKEGGEIYTIISSLSPDEAVDLMLNGFDAAVLASSKHFFEEIRVLRLRTRQLGPIGDPGPRNTNNPKF